MPTHVVSEGVPDPYDIHVGARIRLRRQYQAMRQTALATAVGLTFQQIQKYERGINRVACSTLVRIARALDAPVGYFFEGIETAKPESSDMDKIASAVLIDGEVRDLVGGFIRLAPETRRAIKTMVVEMGK